MQSHHSIIKHTHAINLHALSPKLFQKYPPIGQSISKVNSRFPLLQKAEMFQRIPKLTFAKKIPSNLHKVFQKVLSHRTPKANQFQMISFPINFGDNLRAYTCSNTLLNDLDILHNSNKAKPNSKGAARFQSSTSNQSGSEQFSKAFLLLLKSISN
jgi:hypothetical protein